MTTLSDTRSGFRIPLALLLVAVLCATITAPAADRYKTNNNDNLELSTSWTNGAPATTELAVWDATVSTPANCTNTLNTAKTWGGIKILSPAAPVKVSTTTAATLSLGSSGINLNDANSAQDLWLAVPMTTTAPQTWSVGPVRTLTVGDTGYSVTLNNSVTMNGHVLFPNTININNGGSVTISDATILEPTLIVPAAVINVGNNSAGGAVNQMGGTVKLNRTDGSSGSAKGSMIIASAGSSTATYNISGGSLLDTTPANASTVIIGSGSSSTGTLNVSGTSLVQVVGFRLANGTGASGTINLTNGTINVTGGTFDVGRTTTTTPGPGTVNVYGGVLTSVSSMNLPHGNGPGYFNLFGGSVVLSGGLNLPDAGSAGAGLVNLNGGILTVSAVSHPGTNSGTIVLNGGTLKPSGPTANFIVSSVTVNLSTNGGRVDTSGFDITVPAPLLHGGAAATDGGLLKLGAGTLTLSGASTYTGPTVVSNGTLLVNNPTGSGTGLGNVIVQTNATLGGIGTISGIVTVNSGGALAPGAPLGALTLSNPPALGGELVMQISKTGLTLTSDKFVLAGGGTLTYGGTLNVTATGDPLVPGDTFDLFDAGSFGGQFSATNLPALNLGRTWDLSRLTVDGTIKVAGAVLPPVHPAFDSVFVEHGTNFVFHGTGGFSNGTFFVLSSTDVSLPLANWTLIASSSFDGNGSFRLTNSMGPTLRAQYFALSLSPPILTASETEIVAMLQNMRDDGYDANSNINGGLGELWINWRYGTSPLQVNMNGTGFPDTNAIPRQDDLTDLRYLHNMLWYKIRRPLDTQFNADIQRYTGIVRYEFTGSQNERGWLYDEEMLPMWWLSGDNFFKTNALGQAAYFANSLYKTNLGAYYKTSSTHTNGYYRVDWEVEIGCALVQAGTVFSNADWVAKGHQMVQFAYDHAYLTNYHLFLQQLDNVLLPDRSVNPDETIYLDGDTDGGVVRFGSVGQEALSLLHVYQVTSNQLYLNRAMEMLDPLTVQSNLFGLWDTTYGGYFTGLDFPGPTAHNPGTPALRNTKKEAGRQITMLQAFHVANSVTGNRYAATEAALLNVALQKAYYTPGHGVLYEVNNDWTPVTYNGQLGDWVTTEAMGIVMEAFFSLDEPHPW